VNEHRTSNVEHRTSNADTREVIRRLHEVYVRVTGLAVSLDLQGYRELLWFEWLRNGFTEGDLVAVARYVKGCMRNGERGFNLGTLKFNSLIGQPDKFEELLAETGAARGKDKGSRIKDQRESVLRATGRGGEGGGVNARRADQVAAGVVSDPVKAAAALEELRKLKASL
jgi:hypothetical protein